MPTGVDQPIGVIDGHNDLPIAMRHLFDYDLDKVDLSVDQSSTTLRSDLPRLKAGGMGAQFWSVFVPGLLSPGDAVIQTLEQIDFVYAFARRFPDDLAIAHSANEVREIHRSGKLACLMGAEGGHQIACSMGVLRMYYELGVRYLTLTHNQNIPWADAAVDKENLGGLSDFGVEVVHEMNRLGMLVDLSHVSAGTMRSALEATKAPVIFSHSSARALCDHPRNVPDDVIEKVRENNGVVMVALVPEFIDPQAAEWDLGLRDAMEASGASRPGEDWRKAREDYEKAKGPMPTSTLAQVADHIEHIREVAGVAHIGVGGDYNGVAGHPIGLEDVSCYPALWAELRDRGWSQDEIDLVAGENALRALSDAEEVAEKLQASTPMSHARLET